MNSAEDELEAALWSALTRHKVTVNDGLALMADLVAAAVAYAASDSEALTAVRRMVLHEATAPGPGHTSPSTATGVRRPPVSELDSSGSHGRLAERATMSTDRSIPAQVRASRPQPVDNSPVEEL